MGDLRGKMMKFKNKYITKYFIYLLLIGMSYFVFLFGYITSDYLPLTQSDDIAEKLMPNFKYLLVNKW